jgi:hypothetical protein
VARLIDCSDIGERKDGAVQPAVLLFFIYHGIFIRPKFYQVSPEILPSVTNIHLKGTAKRLGPITEKYAGAESVIDRGSC